MSNNAQGESENLFAVFQWVFDIYMSQHPRSLVVSGMRSETIGSWFDSGYVRRLAL